MMNPRKDRWTIADIFEFVGIDCFNQGQFDDAVMMLKTAVDQGESENDEPKYMVSKYHNLGVALHAVHENADAEHWFQRSLQCFLDDASLNENDLALLLNNYASLMSEKSEPVLAEAFSVCAEFVTAARRMLNKVSEEDGSEVNVIEMSLMQVA
ncbi:MAG: hypothetical protein GC154_10020 [bacterium]|nr:hypothetical protein [bacterium]